MEQFFSVYEYRYGTEAYRFEAGNEHEAEMSRNFALTSFREKLGAGFDAAKVQGPVRIELPLGAVQTAQAPTHII